MANADILPSYNALFPEEETNVVVNGRRRYTTITLREIYYPGGCPCHPKERKLSKKSGKTRQEPLRLPPNTFEPDPLHDCLWLGHARPTINERSASQSSESSSRSSQTTASTSSNEPSSNTTLAAMRRNSTAPSADSKSSKNVYFSVVDVDSGIAQTGYSLDSPATSSVDNPVFVTSQLKWWKQKMMLPPSFEIFHGGVDAPGHGESSRERRDLLTSEITGLPSPGRHENIESLSESSMGLSNSTHGKPYPLAEIKYHGWQGITGMSISLTLYNITPSMHYQHSYTHSLSEDIRYPVTPDIRSQYTISRTGYRREYILRRGTDTESYKWRSPSLPEKNATVHSPAGDALFCPSATGHGNLILEDPAAKVVAVYRQRRDYDVLGSLTVSTPRLHGSKTGVATRDVPDERITLEAVTASCLAVVIYERVGWQNLLGR